MSRHLDDLARTAAGTPRSRRRRAALLLALAPVLGGCQMSLLNPAGPVGDAQRTILLNALAIMLAIVVPTIAAIFAFTWWFRASNTRAHHRPNWAYSGALELLVWSIPVLVILFLGGITWIGSHDLDPARPLGARADAGAAGGNAQPLEVQVVSLDWKWLFVYPEQGVASINELTVPTGRPVHFTLTSASVMNSFFVPQLGSMIYTMSGMATQLNLRADREGEFEGLSTHFSGDGFPGMRFKLRSVAPDAFVRWVDGARASGPALDRAGYDALAEQSSNVAPSTYRSVQDNLFRAIVSGEIPPAPGPREGVPTPSVSNRSAAICTPARPRGEQIASARTNRPGE